MIATALHPFLVHFLVAAAAVFLLSRIPGRLSVALSPMRRFLCVLLLILFPLVVSAGILARAYLLGHHVQGNERGLTVHLWMGVLTAIVWIPMVTEQILVKEEESASRKRSWFQRPWWWVLAASMLVATAFLGGELVYGSHGFAFPVK